MSDLRVDYEHYIASQLDNFTVKFLMDDYISQVISLSDDKLKYFEAKKLLLNIMASDDFASVLSSEYHKHMDDTLGRGVTSDYSSSPTVTEDSKVRFLNHPPLIFKKGGSQEMKATILGVEYVDYVKKKDNQRIIGFSVYISKEPHPDKANNFKGIETQSIWVSSNNKFLFEKLRSIPVNMEYDFIYEYDGRFTTLVDIKEIVPVNKN